MEDEDVFTTFTYLPEAATTFSENVSAIEGFIPTPVALSAGAEDESVGAVTSAVVVKLSAVEDEIPA